MKTLLIILINLHIICNNYISNENICGLIKNNGSFTGLKIYSEWIIDFPLIPVYYNYGRKQFMYSNGKQWEYRVFQYNDGKYGIKTMQNNIEAIDESIINRIGVLSGTQFNLEYNCQIYYKVIIFISFAFLLFFFILI